MTGLTRLEGSSYDWCRDVGVAMNLWSRLTLHIMTINDMFTLWSRQMLAGYVRIHFVSDV